MHSDEIDCVGNVDRDDVDQSGRVVDSQFNDTGKVLDKNWKILVGLKQRRNNPPVSRVVSHTRGYWSVCDGLT